jgi:hypothetical protein
MSLTTATCAKGERSNASSTRVQRAVAAARIKTSNVPTAILMPISPLRLSKVGFLPYHPRQSIVDSPAWKIALEYCNLNSTNTAPKARKLALPTLAPAPSQTEQTNRPSNTTSPISWVLPDRPTLLILPGLLYRAPMYRQTIAPTALRHLPNPPSMNTHLRQTPVSAIPFATRYEQSRNGG